MNTESHRKSLAKAEQLRAKVMSGECDRSAVEGAVQELLELLFAENSSSVSADSRRAILDLLGFFSTWLGKGLQDTMSSSAPRPQQSKRDTVVRAFYLGGALDELSAAEKAFHARGQLRARIRRKRVIMDVDHYIHFLKDYSSFSPLLVTDTGKTGGGYFVSGDNVGCVVDPGPHFLDNFLRSQHVIDDIDCIVVTHFHDDHYADFPALLSLIYQRSRDNCKKIDLYLDEKTRVSFSELISAAPYVRTTVTLDSKKQEWINLSAGLRLRPLKTRHDVTGPGDWSGVGLDFRLKKEHRLLITGDTGWHESFSRDYAAEDSVHTTLVAHVSTVNRDEMIAAVLGGPPQFYEKHLCVQGLCQAIETSKPRVVIISEIGEELKSVAAYLAKLIESTYKVKCHVCRNGLEIDF